LLDEKKPADESGLNLFSKKDHRGDKAQYADIQVIVEAILHIFTTQSMDVLGMFACPSTQGSPS
jgi:hypothetical protein